MEDAPLPIIQTPKEETKESFEIKQEEKNYKMNINIINQEIILNIFDEKDFMKEYEIKLTFDELKNIHKIFLTFNSCKDFIDFIKASIENKKILIKKDKDNQVTIILLFEYIFKQNTIKFELNQKKMNFESSIQDLYQKYSHINEICKNLEMNYNKLIEDNKNIKEENNRIKEESSKIKEDNKNLKQENLNLKNEMEKKFKIIEDENKNLINRINNLELKINSSNKVINRIKQNNLSNSIDSTIIERNELDMIKSAVKERMNKEIKEIKKIYQATIDGDDSETFHKLCDSIPNTLVFYKSAGNRRFGGFASQCWKSTEESIEDKNCFLFSLDKKKIYYSKKNDFKVDNYLVFGPSFSKGGFCIINIVSDALKYKSLKTNEKGHKDIFGGDENALSEDGKFDGVYAKEYEVFQIIFE